jgi:hypothetical protein
MLAFLLNHFAKQLVYHCLMNVLPNADKQKLSWNELLL